MFLLNSLNSLQIFSRPSIMQDTYRLQIFKELMILRILALWVKYSKRNLLSLQNFKISG